mgnify:CR=1 FL=1
MEKFKQDKHNIKLFICDFDGIFTDGKLTVYSDGKTSKVIDYKDIMAIANLLKKNIKFAIISGEKSSAMGTVGLSLGITSSLDEVGKVIIIIAMFLGRVFPVTLLCYINSKSVDSNIEYPDAKISLT